MRREQFLEFVLLPPKKKEEKKKKRKWKTKFFDISHAALVGQVTCRLLTWACHVSRAEVTCPLVTSAGHVLSHGVTVQESVRSHSSHRHGAVGSDVAV